MVSFVGSILAGILPMHDALDMAGHIQYVSMPMSRITASLADVEMRPASGKNRHRFSAWLPQHIT
jgi:hypothetical protein